MSSRPGGLTLLWDKFTSEICEAACNTYVIEFKDYLQTFFRRSGGIAYRLNVCIVKTKIEEITQKRARLHGSEARLTNHPFNNLCVCYLYLFLNSAGHTKSCGVPPLTFLNIGSFSVHDAPRY